MNIFKKYRTTIILVAAAVAGGILLYGEKPSRSTVQVTQASVSEEKIYVQITGAVVNEGVYEVNPDDRLCTVIEMAGGLTEDAYTGNMNLAAKVSDGKKISVLTNEEWENIKEQEDSTLVNINTAGLDRLMTLPGIGEQKAKLIIKYREENGSFETPEDIMKITGIKQAVYEKIKELISV